MKKLLALFLGLCMSVVSLAKDDFASNLIQQKITNNFQFKHVVVAKTDFAGLYEVATEEGIFYVGEKADFLISGNLYDLNKDKQVALGRYVSKALNLTFDKLPFEHAIKRVHGKGERKIVVFEDPFCTYCRRLDRDLAKLDNVTVYTFLLMLYPKSSAYANRVWCSDHPSKSWEDWMVRGIEPKQTKSDCAYPMKEVQALAASMGVRATPNIFFPNDDRVNGYVPLSELEKHWQ